MATKKNSVKRAAPGTPTVGTTPAAIPMPDTGEAIAPNAEKAGHLAVIADWVRATGGDPVEFGPLAPVRASGGQDMLTMTQKEAVDETFATVCPAIADGVELALPGAVRSALDYFGYEIPKGSGAPLKATK